MRKNKTAQDKMKARLDKLNAQIELLKAKAKNAQADAKIQYQNQLEKVSLKRDTLQSKLKKLQGSGGEAWQDLKTGMNKAFKDLQGSFKKAASRFK